MIQDQVQQVKIDENSDLDSLFSTANTSTSYKRSKKKRRGKNRKKKTKKTPPKPKSYFIDEKDSEIDCDSFFCKHIREDALAEAKIQR